MSRSESSDDSVDLSVPDSLDPFALAWSELEDQRLQELCLANAGKPWHFFADHFPFFPPHDVRNSLARLFPEEFGQSDDLMKHALDLQADFDWIGSQFRVPCDSIRRIIAEGFKK